MRDYTLQGESEDNRWRGGGARHRGMACRHRIGAAVGRIDQGGWRHSQNLFYSGHIRNFVLPRRTTDQQVRKFMTDNLSRVDGARVLADLHALRAIGTYKTGVHKPTFSEPHMRSLAWLVQRLPEAGLTGEIDGIGNVLGTSTKARAEIAGGLASRKPELRGLARWTARRGLCARSRPRHQSAIRTLTARSKSQPGATRKAISAVSSAAGPMSAAVTEADIDARPRPQQRQDHA